MSKNDPAERTVRDIRRKTRKQYTAEEKIRIVVSGLRGEESIGNVTPADAYFGRHTAIIEKRKRIKKTDHPKPQLEPSTPSGLTSNKDEPDPPL